MEAHYFRRVFLATLISSPLFFSACSSLVREPEAPVPIDPPIAVRIETVPAVDPRFVPEPEAATPAGSATAAQEPQPVEYADLFDRLRAGYQLDYVDRPAIEQQLAWYVNHPDYLERTIGRSERYLYHVVSELEARNMPTELALLPVVESAYEPFGYSRARASGLWQFIPGTGVRYGLKQNWWYDGRRDVLESTRAALDYLQALHDEFNGDWLLAIAAYNSGELNVQRAIQRNLQLGKPTDFWNLKLPKETRAYVPKLLAMSQIVADPRACGLEFSVIANEPYFAKVETGGQIDLQIAAQLANIDNEELAYLNPGFNRWATDPDGPHYLLLPVDTSETFREGLAQLPAAARVPLASQEVFSGETLTTFARRNGVSMAVVRQLNGLTGTRLKAGQTLLVPASSGDLHPKIALAAARVDNRASSGRTRGNFHVVRRGESLWSIARRNGIDVTTLASMNGMQPGDVLPAGSKLRLRGGGSAKQPVAVAGGGEQMTYTVRRGDTLYDIARRFSVSIAELLNWNGLSKSDPLMPGQKLVMYVNGRRSG